MSDCCPTTKTEHDSCHRKSFDYILWGSGVIVLIALAIKTYVGFNPFITDTNPLLWYRIELFAGTIAEMLRTMWWGVALGILFVGLMAKTPKEYFAAILGEPDSPNGIIRACIAGLFLDLCNHGILMVGAKLYERGASTAQVMAFLIASPWNSLSLTFILVALIGLKWTLVFIIASAAIAILTGLIFRLCEHKNILPANPNSIEIPKDFSLITDAKARLKTFKLTPKFFLEILTESRKETAILLRWLLFSIILIALARATIPPEMFGDVFGPTILGLFATLGIATILEVCSEGSAPIASEFINSAHAPGNAFTFLMAGVSTDYTEIGVLKDTTKSWKTALFLPLISVPQIVILGIIMNLAG